MASNPFDEILQELNNLKTLLNTLISNSNRKSAPKVDLFKYMPIQDIFDQKLMARSTFYKYMRQDKFKLYKFGGCSYVDRSEFENAFHAVQNFTFK